MCVRQQQWKWQLQARVLASGSTLKDADSLRRIVIERVKGESIRKQLHKLLPRH